MLVVFCIILSGYDGKKPPLFDKCSGFIKSGFCRWRRASFLFCYLYSYTKGGREGGGFVAISLQPDISDRVIVK